MKIQLSSGAAVDAKLIEYANAASSVPLKSRKYWRKRAVAAIRYYYPLNAAAIIAEWDSLVRELVYKRFFPLPSPSTGLRLSASKA